MICCMIKKNAERINKRQKPLCIINYSHFAVKTVDSRSWKFDLRVDPSVNSLLYDPSLAITKHRKEIPVLRLVSFKVSK